MRSTLLGIGALTLAVLGIAQCNSENDGNMMGTADLASGAPDLASGDPDLATPADQLVASTPREFMVVRIGSGAAALNNDATAAFLERRNIQDGALVGAPLALPTAVNGTNKQLTLSGLATVEGQLSRSADGRSGD